MHTPVLVQLLVLVNRVQTSFWASANAAKNELLQRITKNGSGAGVRSQADLAQQILTKTHMNEHKHEIVTRVTSTQARRSIAGILQNASCVIMPLSQKYTDFYTSYDRSSNLGALGVCSRCGHGEAAAVF